MGRAPVAHEHLAQIDPALQEELSRHVLALNHEALGIDQSDFGPDFSTPIPEDQRTPEQSEHHERVTELMGLAAGLTREAHQLLSEQRKVKGEDSEVTSEEVLQTAKALALDTAEAAKQRGDREAIKVGMRGYLTLGLLGDRDAGYEVSSGPQDAREIVHRGLASELIDGLQDLSGVVALSSSSSRSATESRERFSQSERDMLSVASGRDLSTGVELATEQKEERIARLSGTELITLALALKAEGNADEAKTLALQSLYRTKYISSYKEMVGVIRAARSICVDAKTQEPTDDFMEGVTKLRLSREAGSHYRGNSPHSFALDQVVIDLAKDGELDMAYALISSSQHELSGDINNPGNLNRVIEWGEDFSEAEKVRITEIVTQLHQRKQLELSQALSSAGVDHQTIEGLIMSANDPDSALGVSQEFWQSYPGMSIELKDLVINNHIYNIAEASQIVQSMISEGLDTNLAKNEIFRGAQSQSPEQRGEYLRSIKALTVEIHAYVQADKIQRGYTFLREDGLLQRYLDFQDPMAAWQFGEKLLGPGSIERGFELAKLMEQSYGERSIALDRGRVELLIRLKQELHDYPAIWDNLPRIKSMIIDSASPDKAAERFISVFQHTEFGKLIGDEGPAREYADFLLTYVMRDNDAKISAERIADVFTKTGFAELVSVDGAGFGLGRSLVESVIQADDSYAMAEQLVRVFAGGGSLWHTTSELADLIVRQGFYDTGATTRRIPTSLPTRITRGYSPEAVVYAKDDEMADLLRLYGVDESAIQHASANDWNIEISSLPTELKKTLLTADLYEAISRSRDSELREIASKRNAELTSDDMWARGSLHHVTRAATLLSILQNGALPGELVLDSARADSYPFNLDLCEATSEVLGKPTHGERVDSLASRNFGDTTVHFVRDSDGYRAGEEFVVPGGYGGQHRLVPGGLPSTEISGITIGNPEQLTLITHALLEAGMYIPIFAKNGDILISYERYQQLREDGNYEDVQPEIVDTKFQRPNSQSGSNEGSEFIVPSDIVGGKPERYYVKFAQPENEGHLWTELLSDTIYRTVDPAIVPDTRPVILEGRLARASRMAETDATPVTAEARNAGFMMDCLLGNWDATYNAANLIMSGGHALRIDTGNTLFYKARGGRKPDGAFGGIVTEVQVGTDSSDLGSGMRQNYAGLTKEQIKSQAQLIQEKLPDTVIDELVDGVRMTTAERTELKQVLKARRDYLINWSQQQ